MIYLRGWLELRLKSNNEVLIHSGSQTNKQVLDKNVSKVLTSILLSVIEFGTGKVARIKGWKLAGKTGTSQDARDAWFTGFSSDYVVGVWMGSDDNKPLNGVPGGNLPAEIWSSIMSKIHKKVSKRLSTLSNQELEASLQKSNTRKKAIPRRKGILDKKNDVILKLFDYQKNINK